MIQIYSVNNTNYEKNGDALLPSSAYVHVILNGAWEAELVHPIDPEGRWKSITEESVIKMPSFNGNQLFRIKAVEKQDSGVTATMEPIFYDSMNDCFLEDIRPNGDNGQAALTKMLSPNSKYSASSNITKTATAYYQYVNFLEALNGDLDQSFIKRWGGEILFDNYTVIVNNHVGGDYGAELRYGKNIPKNGMSFDVDNRDIVTRIYPKAYEGRMMSNNGHVDSPLINNYPTVKAATMTFENVKLSSDLQGDPEDTDIVCDTQAELDQALEEMCEAQFSAGLDKPKVTISVDMVLLQNTEQYKDVKNLEEVSLGDTVRIYNRHLGIMSEARIIELEYDAIRKKVSSVVIGDYEYNYFNDVSSATEIIKNVVNPDGTLMAERVQGILNGVYTQLRLQSTAAQKVDGVAFKVEELDDESPLYGCMIWGTQGIQISTTRTADGKDWDWTTAITARGIVANAIITGLLSDKTGNNYWDLDTGEFRLSSTYVTIDGDNIGDYVDSTLTQQEVFNKLTNNGVAKGLYLTADNELYFNATYIKTGIITDNVGNNYWNLATGEFRLSDTTTLGGDSIATKNDVTDLDDSLNQQEVFDRLTNNGAAKGIALVNGVLYINADYINSGTVKGNFINAKNLVVTDRSGNTTFAIDSNGNVTIRAASFSLQGSSIQSIADNAADSALTSANNYTDTKASSALSSAQNYADNEASNALQQAKNYTDLQIENFDPDLTQQEVFNILTNNGQTQGIYLSGGKIYINATYIGSGTISASRIAADSITASKLSISDLYAIGATIGGFVIGSQGMRSSNSSLRLWSDGRIQIGACVLSANSNAFQVRYGLHIYCDPSVFSDGSGYFKIFNLAHVTSGGHLVFNSDGATVAYLSSSSKRYKNHISDVPDEEALRILDIPVIKFKYKDGYLFPTDFLVDKEIPGFYAEDVEGVNPILCQYNEDGSVEDWNYRTMIPYMVKTMQIQQKQIDDLEARIAKLEKGEVNA